VSDVEGFARSGGTRRHQATGRVTTVTVAWAPTHGSCWQDRPGGAQCSAHEAHAPCHCEVDERGTSAREPASDL